MASMGPRSADRGNYRRPRAPHAMPRLQWGRDQLIAEIDGAAHMDATVDRRFNGAAIS